MRMGLRGAWGRNKLILQSWEESWGRGKTGNHLAVPRQARSANPVLRGKWGGGVRVGLVEGASPPGGLGTELIDPSYFSGAPYKTSLGFLSQSVMFCL